MTPLSKHPISIVRARVFASNTKRNIHHPHQHLIKMASLFLRSVRATANPAFTTLRAAKTPTLRRFLATPAEQPRLRIGSEAPNFQAKTTAGDIDFHQWLDGKWAILFSHPADFTPVCTTELGAFAKLSGEFEKRDVKMIGLVS
jgi:hypothetical protein